MQIRKIAPAVIFIFMTMFTLQMFAFNRLDVKRELTLRFKKQNLSDLFQVGNSRTVRVRVHEHFDRTRRWQFNDPLNPVRESLIQLFKTKIYIILLFQLLLSLYIIMELIGTGIFGPFDLYLN